MKVITEFPVYIDSRLVGGTDWLNLDGSSAQSDILAFQKFANSKGYSPRLVEDGVWGRKTKAAFSALGSQFGAPLVTSSQTILPTPNTTTAPTPTATQQAEAKKKGFNWDKAKGVWVKAGELGITDKLLGLFGITPKPDSSMPDVSTGVTDVAPTEKKGMSKTTKLLIAGAGVLVVGLIIFAATRPKKGK
jgi:hypothetical protein